MTCQGGCIHGAGMPFTGSREDIRNRAKVVYQADENEAINLPCKSPSIITLYDKIIRENPEIAGKEILHTHFEKRNVLL
jgi:iron only hydrogenase large subunit-like protein